MIGPVSVSSTSRSRDLVAVSRVARVGEPPRVEAAAAAFGARLDRDAEFLAQLLAARDGMAQTRQRRRAAPSEAVAAYAAMPARLRPFTPIEIAVA